MANVMHQAGWIDLVGRDGRYDTGESWLVIVLFLSDPHSLQTATMLSLEKRLVFLSQYPEIPGITGALKLDCEGCVHPRCIANFP